MFTVPGSCVMSSIGNLNSPIGSLDDQRSIMFLLIEECATIASASALPPITAWWPGIIAIRLSIMAIVMHWSKNNYGCK